MAREQNNLRLASPLETEPAFTLTFRGYNKREVDQYAHITETQLNAAVAERNDLVSRVRTLTDQLHQAHGELVDLRRRPSVDAKLSFRHLGPRIEQILAEAEQQADAVRAAAAESLTAERKTLRGRARQGARSARQDDQRVRDRQADTPGRGGGRDRPSASRPSESKSARVRHTRASFGPKLRRLSRAPRWRRGEWSATRRRRHQGSAARPPSRSPRPGTGPRRRRRRSLSLPRSTRERPARRPSSRPIRRARRLSSMRTKPTWRRRQAATQVRTQAEQHAAQVRAAAEKHVARLYAAAPRSQGSENPPMAPTSPAPAGAPSGGPNAGGAGPNSGGNASTHSGVDAGPRTGPNAAGNATPAPTAPAKTSTSAGARETSRG